MWFGAREKWSMQNSTFGLKWYVNEMKWFPFLICTLAWNWIILMTCICSIETIDWPKSNKFRKFGSVYLRCRCPSRCSRCCWQNTLQFSVCRLCRVLKWHANEFYYIRKQSHRHALGRINAVRVSVLIQTFKINRNFLTIRYGEITVRKALEINCISIDDQSYNNKSSNWSIKAITNKLICCYYMISENDGARTASPDRFNSCFVRSLVAAGLRWAHPITFWSKAFTFSSHAVLGKVYSSHSSNLQSSSILQNWLANFGTHAQFSRIRSPLRPFTKSSLVNRRFSFISSNFYHVNSHRNTCKSELEIRGMYHCISGDVRVQFLAGTHFWRGLWYLFQLEKEQKWSSQIDKMVEIYYCILFPCPDSNSMCFCTHTCMHIGPFVSMKPCACCWHRRWCVFFLLQMLLFGAEWTKCVIERNIQIWYRWSAPPHIQMRYLRICDSQGGQRKNMRGPKCSILRIAHIQFAIIRYFRYTKNSCGIHDRLSNLF